MHPLQYRESGGGQKNVELDFRVKCEVCQEKWGGSQIWQTFSTILRTFFMHKKQTHGKNVFLQYLNL